MPFVVTAPSSTTQTFTLDALAENAANSPLELNGGDGIGVLEFSCPAPPSKLQWASSVDTEGSRVASQGYENRSISVTVDCEDYNSLAALQTKVAKIAREGGTLTWVTPAAETKVFDLLAAPNYEPTFDQKFLLGGVTTVSFSFDTAPFARGVEVDLGDNIETTLPALIFTEAAVPGEVPGQVRLVIDEDQAVDQQFLVFGMETDAEYDITQSSAGLFYQAESLTALSSSATAVGPTGASGAGSNVMRNTALSNSYQAILSTQATGGGAHLTHVGTFAVYARVQAPTANTGTVSLALEWGEGDFRRFTQNATYTLDTTWEGTWRLVPLGLVTLSKILTGSQRWEGRVLAKSTTAGDDIDVDWIMLVPTSVAYGEIRALSRQPTSTGFSARDEFDQTAGVLSGKTLPIGGTWSGAGSATDFTVETAAGGGGGSRAAALNRTTAGVADGSVTAGRFGIAGTATFTNITMGIDRMWAFNDGTGLHGLFARYTDTNNWVAAGYDLMDQLRVYKRVAGTVTSLASIRGAANGVENSQVPVPGGFVFTVYANGLWTLLNRTGGQIGVGYDADLATGGPLATGKIGVYAANGGALTAFSESFDNFWAAVPPADAAVFASQSVQIRHDGVIREDSTGAFWQIPSSYEGDYLKVPPAGAEGRTLRCILKASRFAPGDGPDAGIDDISARLFVTPRYLT